MNPFKRSNSNKIHAENSTVVPLSDADITAYTCPISMEIMIDPVINKEGYTYERSAIMEWLKTKNTCPLCRVPMTSRELVPNKNLRETIEKCRENGQLPKLVPPLPSRASCVWSATGNNSHSSYVNRHEMVIEREPTQEQINSRNIVAQMIMDIRRQINTVNRVIIPSPATYNSHPLDPVDIPENPDLSFLQMHEKNMIQSAYITVSRLNKWDYMRRYNPSIQTGYMFDRDQTMGEITSAIDNNYNGGHSGMSMGYTMRRIQYIAKNGFEKFKEDYCQSNN